MSREGSDSEVDLANADVHFTTESGLNSDEVDGSRSRHLGAKV